MCKLKKSLASEQRRESDSRGTTLIPAMQALNRIL